MIRYVPTSGLPVAEALSAALWELSRPKVLQGPRDTTKMFGVVTCLNGSVWLEVHTTFDIPVHPDAVLNGIADVLQPWIDEGVLPADTNETLGAFIESKRGQWLIPWDAFPQFFKDASKSREELISLGLFPSSITP